LIPAMLPPNMETCQLKKHVALSGQQQQGSGAPPAPQSCRTCPRGPRVLQGASICLESVLPGACRCRMPLPRLLECSKLWTALCVLQRAAAMEILYLENRALY
jgi:hypothetical protein